MDVKQTENCNNDCETSKHDNKEVVFAGEPSSDNNKRKRYLTAKYDRKTRQKVTEKIRLENFVFDNLRKLYKTDVDDYDCNIDLDDLLALESVDARIGDLKDKLSTCPASKEEIENFIQILVKKLDSLP